MDGYAGYFWAGFGVTIASCLVTIMALVYIELFNRLLDRYLVRVKLRMVHIISDGDKQILYEAVNVNARSITLSSFGLLFKGKQWATLKITPRRRDTFPITLGIGNTFNYYSPIEELIIALGTVGRLPSDLHSVWFESSTGTVFRGKVSRWFKKELEEAIFTEKRELYTDSRKGVILATGQKRDIEEKIGVLFR